MEERQLVEVDNTKSRSRSRSWEPHWMHRHRMARRYPLQEAWDYRPPTHVQEVGRARKFAMLHFDLWNLGSQLTERAKLALWEMIAEYHKTHGTRLRNYLLPGCLAGTVKVLREHAGPMAWALADYVNNPANLDGGKWFPYPTWARMFDERVGKTIPQDNRQRFRRFRKLCPQRWWNSLPALCAGTIDLDADR